MTNKVEQCPNCGSRVKSVLTYDRLQHNICAGDYDYYNEDDDDDDTISYCGWEGEPFTPTKRKIKTTKSVSYFEGGHWVFELYDDYGQILMHSQGYSTKDACEKNCKKELSILKNSNQKGSKNCVGILWPPTVIVEGIKIK